MVLLNVWVFEFWRHRLTRPVLADDTLDRVRARARLRLGFFSGDVRPTLSAEAEVWRVTADDLVLVVSSWAGLAHDLFAAR